MTRAELVRKAIHFGYPERVPIWFVNCDQTEGDAIVYHLSLNRPNDDPPGTNEWGYKLEKLGDGTMGHPVAPALPDWESAERLEAPPLREDERMAPAKAYFDLCEDRYRLASLDLSGFTVYTLLRGFENSMTDFLVEPEKAARLLDLIFDWECDLIRLCARRGFHGMHFADDWGTQSGLMISRPLWSKLFKPRYQRQFALARELGLDVWFHCCGNITELVEDFHEIGTSVLNLSQPNVIDVVEVSRRLRGKQCFLMPISYQTVSISGTPEEIYAEARRLFDLLAVESGGFIGYVEEYGCMGMSNENYRACAEAFRRLTHGTRFQRAVS
jgi:uroporphyrinogen-III decarboxylase